MPVHDDPHASELIPLGDLSEILATHPSTPTVFRWASRGAYGITLKVVSVGATRCTTDIWLMEFFAQVEDAKKARREPVPDKPARRRRSRRSRARPCRDTDAQTTETLRRLGVTT